MRSDIEMLGVETGEHLATDEEASLARTRAALDLIGDTHAHKPTCVLCGQRANSLDRFGLCAKVSGTHLRYREEERAS
jgi:hypothetical protein